MACEPDFLVSPLYSLFRSFSNKQTTRFGRPGALHGLAGEISTIVNVFTQQGGKFSATALVTAIVTAACTVVCGVLVLLYSTWKLERVKRAHHRTLGTEEQWEGTVNEGMVEKTKRKGRELEPEAGVTV